MAELLLLDVDRSQIPGAYKKGDCFAIMPDGHVWGDKEVPPICLMVQLPGVSIESLSLLLQPGVGNQRRSHRYDIDTDQVVEK